MTHLAIPKALEPFAGRIVDVDSHEMVPAQLWEQEFGPVVSALAERFRKSGVPNNPGGLNYPDYKRDDAEITTQSVWKLKGPAAPGSTDPKRRLEVMDITGVNRQLMFPSGIAVPASFMFSFPDEPNFLSEFPCSPKEYGRKLLAANNEWAIRAGKVSKRIRPVTPLYGDTPAELIANTKHLIDNGIRAVWLLSTILPGGKSPAHSDLDPFYKMLTDHDVTLTLHLGSEHHFFRTYAWGDAPAFEGYKVNVEFNLSPWHLSVVHMPTQNFLGTMITGGVFERHPKLRLGVIEVGGYWIGPMADTLDMWYANSQQFGERSVDRLPKKPSEYIRSNVRVSVFDFEKIDDYIQKYDGLEDVLCYASDFPHIEGGKDPMGDFVRRLERFGPRVMEKFFVTNGEFLFPAV